MSLVGNLLCAIGAPAHLSRSNFPIPAGDHPGDVDLELYHFCHGLIDHLHINAGMSFTMARDIARLPSSSGELRILRERLEKRRATLSSCSPRVIFLTSSAPR